MFVFWGTAAISTCGCSIGSFLLWAGHPMLHSVLSATIVLQAIHVDLFLVPQAKEFSMACRAALAACLFLVYSVSDLLARDCTCLKVGLGLCVPDPACSANKAIQESVQSFERARQEADQALENAARQSAAKGANSSAEQDVSKAIENLRKSVESVRDTASPIRRLIILETGYSQLP